MEAFELKVEVDVEVGFRVKVEVKAGVEAEVEVVGASLLYFNHDLHPTTFSDWGLSNDPSELRVMLGAAPHCLPIVNRYMYYGGSVFTFWLDAVGYKAEKRKSGRMDGWMEGWMDGWMVGRLDTGTN